MGSEMMNEQLECKVFEILTNSLPNGLSQDSILEELNNEISVQALVKVINGLTQKQQIDILTVNNSNNSKYLFKARDKMEINLLVNLSAQERIVYQSVKDSSGKGTWIKHLKDKSGLHSKVVTDVISKLEKRGIIKLIKSVKNPTRKVYMLSRFEPSVELTGGAWYADNKIDTEFIDKLAGALHRHVHSISRPPNPNLNLDLKVKPKSGFYPLNHKAPTLAELHDWLLKSNLATDPPSLEELGVLVNRLVVDDKITRVLDGFVSCTEPGEMLLESGEVGRVGKGLTDSPCGTCPLFGFCQVDGPVSPKNCVYMTEWLA